MRVNRKTAWWMLAGILVIATLLRVWGLDTGLPNMSRPDEQNISAPVVMSILASFFNGAPSLNPHFFYYPSLYLYVLTIAYGLYFLVGHVTGLFPDAGSFFALYTNNWGSFHLISRAASAAMGVASVGAMYALGAAYFRSRWRALLCALLLALTYLHVRDSHFGVTDIPAMLWVTLSLWLAVLYARTKKQSHLYGALAMAGLAAGTKYPDGMVAIAPLVIWYRFRHAEGMVPGDLINRPSRLLEALRLLGVLFGSFLISSPYVLLDFKEFAQNFTWQSENQKNLDYLNLGRAWFYHARFSLWYGLGSLYVLGALGGMTLALKKQLPAMRSTDIALLSYVAVYYLLIGNTNVTYVRYIIPIIPVFCLYAVNFAVFMGRRLRLQFQKMPLPARAWMLLVVLLLSAQSLWLAIGFDRVIATPDTRNEARDWLLSHLNPGDAAGVGMNMFSHVELPAAYRKYFLAVPEGQALPGAMHPAYIEQQQARVQAKNPGNNPKNEFDITTYGDIDALRKLGVHYVTIGISPLTLYTTPPFEIKKLEDPAHFRRVATFSSAINDHFPQPVADEYDQLDGMYIPYSTMANTQRPGPEMRIYEVLP